MFDMWMCVAMVMLIVCCCVMIVAFVIDEIFDSYDRAFVIAKGGMCVAAFAIIMLLLGLAYQLILECF